MVHKHANLSLTQNAIKNGRCLDKSQFFPPGRSIWCNGGNRKGPTARPTSLVGGHACCGTADFCNLHLKPIILDYRQSPVREYSKGGDAFVVFGFLFQMMAFFHWIPWLY